MKLIDIFYDFETLCVCGHGDVIPLAPSPTSGQSPTMPSLRRAWSKFALRIAILVSLAPAVVFLVAVSGRSGGGGGGGDGGIGGSGGGRRSLGSGLAELHSKAYHYFVAPGRRLCEYFLGS